MIKLDKWDSQLAWLSKGWFEEKDIPLEEAIRNLWSNRSGIYKKFVELGYVANHLFDLLFKLNLMGEHSRGRFLAEMSPVNQYTGNLNYSNKSEYVMRIIWVCLYSFISTIQVKEGDEILIEMLPFEPELLREGLEEPEED